MDHLSEKSLYSIYITDSRYQDDPQSGLFWWSMRFIAADRPPEELLRCGIQDRFRDDNVCITCYDANNGTGNFACLCRGFEPGIYTLSIGPDGAHDCALYMAETPERGRYCKICGHQDDKGGGTYA